jgi:hypothetical protein
MNQPPLRGAARYTLKVKKNNGEIVVTEITPLLMK